MCSCVYAAYQVGHGVNYMVGQEIDHGVVSIVKSQENRAGRQLKTQKTHLCHIFLLNYLFLKKIIGFQCFTGETLAQSHLEFRKPRQCLLEQSNVIQIKNPDQNVNLQDRVFNIECK